MKLSEYLLAELEREGVRSRKALERLPPDKYEWKPHDRSMQFGYLAEMVATMPTWIALTVTRTELDIQPKDGSTLKKAPMHSSAEYLAAFDTAMAEAKSALETATEAHLLEPWQLLVGGHVVINTTRHEMIADSLNHWVHHRGQMTVYLRLLGATVPALYGPSADDQSF